MTQPLALLVSFALVIVLVPILRALAPRLGLIDEPTARKRHLGAIPLVGGIAIFFAFSATLLIFGLGDKAPVAFYAGAALVLILGLADDRRPLRSGRRFVLQAVILLAALVAGGNVLTNLGELVGPGSIGLGVLAIPFTVFGVLGVVNAMNLADGLDGLAGGLALTSLAAFALYFADGSTSRLILLALMGAVAGFLVFNFRTPWRARASIFLGDAGSLMLGFVLGWFAVLACASNGSDAAMKPLSPVSALWILIVPLFDTLGCIARRKLHGRSPMKSDRQHLHHLLQRAGLTVGQTTAVLVLTNAAGAAIGLAAWRYQVPDYLMFAAVVALFCVYLAVLLRAWRFIDRRAPNGMNVSRVHLEPALNTTISPTTKESYLGRT